MNNRVYAVLALFLAIGLIFAYINPTWNGSIAEKKAEIVNDEQALQASVEYMKSQEALIAARDAIDPADLARVTTFLPDSVDNVQLILDFNALSNRTGVALTNIDVSGKSSGSSDLVNADPVGSVDLSIAAVGTYASFQKFLQGVELSARLLDVQTLNVNGSNTGIYNYKLDVRIYWLR